MADHAAICQQRLLHELKHLALGWSLLVSAGAALGALIGWITWADDE
jgi:hypothetical protein